MPFTIAIEPGAVTTSGISLYLRVVKKGADAGPPPAPAKPEKDNKKDKDKAPVVSAQSSYAFENLYMIDTPPARGGRDTARARESCVCRAAW